MGGSSSGTFKYHSPGDIIKQVRKAEDDTTAAAFEAQLSTFLASLLSAANERDSPLIRDRLDEVKHCLQEVIDGSFDQLFGGSVAKHTFVNGLSDVDTLLLINDTLLERKEPQQILSRLAAILSQTLNNIGSITQGRMAVTIVFNDEMVLQILPAIRDDAGLLRVPSSRRDGWSHIDPEKFQQALSKRNLECGGKLIPVIKIAKSIIGQLPESQRLSGYHVESLAIAAFKEYSGQRTTASMLPTFFERARQLVLQPVRDRTGQSIHVDEYLGPADSQERLLTSHVLSRIAKRMRNATAASSSAQWRAILGIDE